MKPILALSGPDITIVDLIAGSAFWVGLLIGSLGIVFRYRPAAIAAGLVEFCVFLFLLVRAAPEEAIFALLAALAFLFLLRREKR
jgi:hypothetical protein